MSKTQTIIVLNRMFFFKYPDVDEAILFYIRDCKSEMGNAIHISEIYNKSVLFWYIFLNNSQIIEYVTLNLSTVWKQLHLRFVNVYA